MRHCVQVCAVRLINPFEVNATYKIVERNFKATSLQRVINIVLRLIYPKQSRRQRNLQHCTQAPQAHNAIIYHLVREFNGEKS